MKKQIFTVLILLQLSLVSSASKYTDSVQSIREILGSSHCFCQDDSSDPKSVDFRKIGERVGMISRDSGARPKGIPYAVLKDSEGRAVTVPSMENPAFRQDEQHTAYESLILIEVNPSNFSDYNPYKSFYFEIKGNRSRDHFYVDGGESRDWPFNRRSFTCTEEN